MRIRHIAATAAAATLTALSIGTPAAATNEGQGEQTAAPPAVTVTATHLCNGTTRVKLRVSSDTARVTIKRGDDTVLSQIITTGSTPQVNTIDGTPSPLTVRYRTKDGDGWGPWLPLDDIAGWQVPDTCLPTITTVPADCDHPTTAVTVTNPDTNGVTPVVVRLASGDETTALTLTRGESATYDLTATDTVLITGGLTGETGITADVDHTTPTGCTTTTAAATTAAGLPVTGSSATTLGILGATAILLGTAGIVAARRRRTRFTA